MQDIKIKPTCLHCGQTLRKFSFRNESWAQAQGREWGGYGDGVFCGLGCGYAYGVEAARLHNLRYDGMMLGLHQFTEVDESSPSYGATFYLKTKEPAEVSRRREEKRAEFAAGQLNGSTNCAPVSSS